MYDDVRPVAHERALDSRGVTHVERLEARRCREHLQLRRQVEPAREGASTTDAATLYERVLAFEPGHYGAALGLARLRAAQGDTAAAAALFQTAADSARTDGEALAARSAADNLEDR